MTGPVPLGMPLPAGSLLAPGYDSRGGPGAAPSGTYPAGLRGTPADCHGDVCITCSDEAVPVTIVELLPDGLALVDTGVSMEEVSVALVDADVGDTILVHAKEAIARLQTGERNDE